jgi:hypothetical protein
MPASRSRLLLPLLFGLSGPLLLAGCPDGAEKPAPPSAVKILTERDGAFEYTFHLITGGEALFDVERDPRRLTNLLQTKPDLARRLRESLSKRLGLSDLKILLDPNDPKRKALEDLGYL